MKILKAKEWTTKGEERLLLVGEVGDISSVDTYYFIQKSPPAGTYYDTSRTDFSQDICIEYDVRPVIMFIR